jgi:hypothetical protein
MASDGVSSSSLKSRKRQSMQFTFVISNKNGCRAINNGSIEFRPVGMRGCQKRDIKNMAVKNEAC